MVEPHQTRQAIIVTDFDIHSAWLCHHYWGYFVALDETREHLAQLGFERARIILTGIPVDPVFREPKDKTGMCLKHGLATDNFSGENILSLFAQCHEALKSTRGVVMSAAFIHHGSNTIEWTGIGNIEGLLLKRACHEWLPLRAGIIGCRLPSLRSSKFTIEIDDMIVMYTDGISHTSTQSLIEARPCDELAHFIISSQAKGTDDAAVLVARYKG